MGEGGGRRVIFSCCPACQVEELAPVPDVQSKGSRKESPSTIDIVTIVSFAFGSCDYPVYPQPAGFMHKHQHHQVYVHGEYAYEKLAFITPPPKKEQSLKNSP